MGKIAARERPIPPLLRQGIGVWTTMMRTRLIKPVDDCYLCGAGFKESLLELDHVVPVSENLSRALDETNLRPICTRCHRNKINAEQPCREGMSKRGVRWEVVKSITPAGEEMTYDIEVSGKHHNYVANGLVVHNSYNEMSARYIPLPDVNYTPSIERLMVNSKSNKQAGTIKGADELTAEAASMYLLQLEAMYETQEGLYQHALKMGVPKELARIHLPVGRYSRMRASANLRNWLAFLTLRMDSKAQWEIRQYANEVGKLIAAAFPRTWTLFDKS
jgi:thymidylate synthase (FAD)